MPRIRVIHWKAAEAADHLTSLRKAGYQTDYEERLQSGTLSRWKASPPEAFLIDLSRLPSHGREIATALRGSKATRHIPIVFVGGVPEKVESIRRLLPDATYTTWGRALAALKRVLVNRIENPTVPAQMMDRYAMRTAAQKLGIGESMTTALINPPRDYAKVLGPLPEGVRLEEDPREYCPVTLCFVRDADTLYRVLPRLQNLAPHTRLWILWPKRASGETSTVDQGLVRESANAFGLVDYKVCSVNETWSAVAFAVKKARA